MTAKQYLSQAAVLKRRIKQVTDRIEELRTEAENPKAIRYDKDLIQKSATGDALANYMIRLDKEEQRLYNLKESYIDKYIEIRERISEVRPDLYADVLYMRYLENKTLVIIADELNYSYEWMCRVHGRALQDFSRRFDDIT